VTGLKAWAKTPAPGTGQPGIDQGKLDHLTAAREPGELQRRHPEAGTRGRRRFVLPDFGDRIRRMIRIAITPAAYAAIAATLALGTVAVEPERAQDGGVHIWLDPGVLAKLRALRGPGESYSDVILRLAKGD